MALSCACARSGDFETMIGKMTPLKAICGLLCLLVLASNLWSMSHWNEARGVYDDVCYLRQAHLFQRFGLSGFNTDISRDDDHYLASKLQEIGYPTWNEPLSAPCHNVMPALKTFVIQYPPGTGLVMAMFPRGRQVVSLYALASIFVFGFALVAIVHARSTLATLLAGVFGCLAIYLMINPSKASYSMAPTMVVFAGTVHLLRAGKHGTHRVALVTAINLAINLAFFLSHPIFTPYYTIPVAMLSLWSLLFAWLMQDAETVEDGLAGQVADARS